MWYPVSTELYASFVDTDEDEPGELSELDTDRLDGHRGGHH